MPDNKFAKQFLTAGIAILIGIAGLLGWASGIERLTALRPDFLPMRPNAALATAFMGLALWILWPEHPIRLRRLAGSALAGSAGILSASALISILTGWNSHLDALIFQYDKWPTPLIQGAQFPLRMGLPAALGLTFGSLAILLLPVRSRRGQLAMQYMVFAAGTIGLMGFLADIFEALGLERYSNYTTVSAHISAAMMILSLGVLVARPRMRPAATLWDKGPIGTVARRLIVSIISVPLLLALILAGGIGVHWFDLTDGLTLFLMMNVIIFILLAGYVVTGLSRTEVIERELRESSERYSTTLASIADAVMVTDIAGNITFMNKVAEQLTGWTFREAQNLPSGKIFRIVNEYTRIEVESPIKSVLEKGIIAGLANHTILIRKDGREVPIDDSGAPVLSWNGRLAGVVLVFRDITERKKAGEEAAQISQRLSAHIDNSPLAVIEFDNQFRVVRWSREAERMFGWTAEEITGKAIAEMHWVYEEDAEKVRQESAGFVDGTRSRSVHANRNYRKDGSVIFCEWHNSAIYDTHGRLVSVLSQVQNATERRQTEEQKNNFISILAHELRNPLTPLLAAMQTLQDMAYVDGDRISDPALLKQCVDISGRQVTHMARLLDDLLDISRIERGKIELKKESVDLASAISHACGAVQPLVQLMGHDLQLELPQEPIITDADPVRLEQIIVNLLNNAAKYTPAGGRIRISVRREGANALITIKDNGIGISSEVQARIFEPFYQVSLSSAKPSGGLGIGLNLSLRLSRLHGGDISVASGGVNLGSEFTVRLPALGQDYKPQKTPELQGTQAGIRRKILLVDDMEDITVALSSHLKRNGHEVAVAHSGREALDIADEFLPELVLLDIGLPEMDGFETARRLRQQQKEKNPGMILAASTGYGQTEDRRRAREAGFDYHLIKPYSLKLLRSIIEGNCGEIYERLEGEPEKQTP